MKLFLSIWNFFSILLLVLCGGAAGVLSLSLPLDSPAEPWDYMWRSILNGCLFGGLLSAVVLSITAPVSALLAFIFKSWYRAAISIAVSAAAMALWKFYMGCSL